MARNGYVDSFPRGSCECVPDASGGSGIATQRRAQIAEDHRLRRSAEALHENKEFRLMLYGGARMPALSAVIESLWLKIGPSLNYLFPIETDRLADPHNHDLLLAALTGGTSRFVR